MSFNEFINYAKDVSGIIVAITGAVIAVLTYRRAKETILQPVRSEVIKKQSELLIELLEEVGDEADLLHKADYQGIVQLNILTSMLLCGAVFKDQKTVEATIEEHRGASIVSEEAAKLFELIPLFPDKNESQERKHDKSHYNAAKQGNFKIIVFEITRERVKFDDKLCALERNPFMPSRIRILLNKLIDEIHINTTSHLKVAIEDGVNKAFESKELKMPSPEGVFNNFNHARLSHKQTQDQLREEIRKYLKIDSMP